MKRLRFNGVGYLKVEDGEVPALGPKDTLVQVRRCGVCGTDLSMWKGTFLVPNLPLTPGHELSGDVVAVGDSVKTVSPGSRVAVDINMTCNECFWCRRGQHLLCPHLVQIGIQTDGGFADYVKVPADQLIPLPPSVSYDQGAGIEPIACVLHAQDRAGIKMGESVAVIGSGLMGFLHARIAELRGASPVILLGKYATRQEIAREIGVKNQMLVDDPATPDKVRELTGGRGADVVIEAAGALPAYDLAFKLVRRGGRIVAYGIPPSGQKLEIDPFFMFNQELSIIGAFVTNRGAWLTAVDLLASGQLNIGPTQSAVVSLDQTVEVPRLMSEDKSLVKILVDPTLPAGTRQALH